MRTFQAISSNIKPVIPEDTIGSALEKMVEVKHLPVISEEGKYICLLEKQVIEQLPKDDLIEKHLNYHWEKIHINDNNHFYSAIKYFIQNGLTLIPVTDKDKNYIGSIEEKDLLANLYKNTGLEHPGGIIVLEIKPMHYSLSEIARICESNDVQIINLQITSHSQRQILEVTLKTNTKDLDAVIAGFERFEYTITEVYGDAHYNDTLKKRYDLLMNYLAM